MKSSQRGRGALLPGIITAGALLALIGAVLLGGGQGGATGARLCPCPTGAAGKVARGKRYNIIVLVVDALRQADLGCYGGREGISPNIDHFAGRSVQFRRAYAQAPWTKPSVASLFTGAYPRRHQMLEERGRNAILSDGAVTMAEVFQAHGYTTVGLSANPNVARHVGLAQGFDRFPNVAGYDNGTTPRLTVEVVKELGRLAMAATPFFLYVHYLDPHDPYDPALRTEFCRRRLAGRMVTNLDLREGKAHILSGEEALGKTLRDGKLPTPLPLTDDERDYLKGLYDCEISLVDKAVGRVLEEVKQAGLEDDTIVLFTSDHGEEFMDHGLMRHGYQVYEEMVKVPLLVRLPASLDRPRQEERVVEQIDILPTLLALNQLPPLQHGVDGDLLPLGGLRPTGKVGVAMGSTHFRQRDVAFLVKGKYKLLVDRSSGAQMLFDLDKDPGEKKPDIRPVEVLTDLLAEMTRRSHVASQGALPPGTPQPRRADDPKPEVIRKQLESLGYIQ